MSLFNLLKWIYSPAAHQDQQELNNSICGEKEFLRILARERARAERSDHRFSLVVFDTGSGGQRVRIENHLFGELGARMRATDEAGRIQENRIGAILHNADARNAWIFARNIQMSMLSAGTQLLCKVYSYPPEEQDIEAGKESESPAEKETPRQHINRQNPAEDLQPICAREISAGKRCLDIAGALLGIVLLSPLFLFLWCLIKSVSPGPAIYRQTRIGLGGRPFTFLKFRTMAINADTSEHRQYLASLIQGSSTAEQNGPKPMAKLDDGNDNIIPFGKLIRKTYLDELPQLVNVLLGDMSLIGPRPPIPYEVEEYKLWHNGRFDGTPGMTGLWQVSGKNRLTFDQMVRLDIQYIRKQSFWLDLRIFFMTPVTIFWELKESFSKLVHIWPGAHEIK